MDTETRKDLGYICFAVALGLLGLLVGNLSGVLGLLMLAVAGFTLVVCLINLALTLTLGPQKR